MPEARSVSHPDPAIHFAIVCVLFGNEVPCVCVKHEDPLDLLDLSDDRTPVGFRCWTAESSCQHCGGKGRLSLAEPNRVVGVGS